METIFINTENSKTNKLHRFRLSLLDKLNLKNPNKNIVLGNLSKNIKNIKNMGKHQIRIQQQYLEWYFWFAWWFLFYCGHSGLFRIIIFRNDGTIWKHKKNVDQDKDGEYVPKLEYVEVVLVHCNLVNNNYQKTSKVLFTFVPNKQFGKLINIASHSLTMLGTTKTGF